MLSDQLKQFRTDKGLSQTDMATALNITRQAYNHYETGKRVPPLDTLKEISRILNTNVNLLIESKDIKTASAKKEESLYEPLIIAYKNADEGTRRAVNKLLDLDHVKEDS